MARAWMKLIWNSCGVAVVAVAAQLGVAGAIGILRWDQDFQTDDGTGWTAQMTWIAFISAVAVLAGAAVGRRVLRRPTRPEGPGVRIAAVLFAAVGAAVGMGVAWLPARGAQSPVNVDPDLAVVMMAGAGIAAGMLIGLVALSAAPVAGSIRAGVAWVWVVAIGSAVAGLASHEDFPAPRLAVIDAPSIVPVRTWTGPDLMIAIAGVLGVVVALLARPGGAHRFGIAVSGFFGPSVIASAYLIAGPGAGPSQRSAYLAAGLATVVGLCTSVIVAIPGRGSEAGRSAPAHGAGRRYDSDDPVLADMQPQPTAGRARRQDSQTAISFDEDYSDWLRDLGHLPAQPASIERQQ